MSNDILNSLLNVDTAKSLATEAALAKTLDKLGLTEVRHMVVRNRKGRFTALFFVGAESWRAMGIANAGFKVFA